MSACVRADELERIKNLIAKSINEGFVGTAVTLWNQLCVKHGYTDDQLYLNTADSLDKELGRRSLTPAAIVFATAQGWYNADDPYVAIDGEPARLYCYDEERLKSDFFREDRVEEMAEYVYSLRCKDTGGAAYHEAGLRCDYSMITKEFS